MAATWPSSLPQRFRTDGYSYRKGDGRLHSQTDMGPGKVRRRFTAVVDRMAGAMTLTQAQWETLRSFIDDEAGGGALPFWFPSPVDGAPLLVRFGQDGLPSLVPHGVPGEWVASFQLDVLP